MPEDVNNSLNITDKVVAELIGGDGRRSYRVSDSAGVSRHSDAGSDGGIRYGGAGPAPQGEEGTREVADAVAKLLFPDTAYELVDEPHGQSSLVDVEIRVRGAGVVEPLQVVRAPVTPEFRARLARTSIDAQLDPAEGRAAILEAIAKKAAHYSTDRSGVNLVLDLSDLSALAAPTVIEPLVALHTEDLARAGFKRIFVADTHTRQAARLFDGTTD